MKLLYRVFSLILSLAILYFLLRQIAFQDIQLVLKNIQLEFLLAALGTYLLLSIFRTLRFSLLLNGKIGFWKAANITLAHNFINSLLPARTGELSYVYYVRRSGLVGLGSNLASLFLSRIFDFLLVIILMLLSLAFLAGSILDLQRLVMLGVIGLALILALILSIIFWETKIIWFFQFIFSLFRINRLPIGEKILIKLREAVAAMGQLRERRLFLKSAGWTLLIWLLIFFRTLLIAWGFGLEINFWQAIFIGGLPTLASIIPFYAIGNFGIFEGSTVLAMVLLGFSSDLSISFSLLSHVAAILIAAIPGVFSYLILARK